MNKISVLFVDDEMIVRVALNSIVNWSETEFRIAGTVSNGEEALDFIKKNPVQLVVTDLEMPNMDGIELVRRLYESDFKGKVIILSSYGEFEYAQKAIRYGVSEYLIKATFNGDTLLEAMQRAAKDLVQIEEKEETAPGTEDHFDEELIRKVIEQPQDVILEEDTVFSSSYYAYLICKRTGSEKKGTKEMFSSLIRETLTKKDGAFLIPVAADKAVVLAKELEEDVFVSKLRNAARMYMNTEIVLLKSYPFSNKNEMIYYLTDLPKVKELIFYKGFNHLILQEEFSAYQNSLPKKAKQSIISFCRSIYQGSFGEARMQMEQILTRLEQDRVNALEAGKLLQMITSAIRLTCRIYFEDNDDKFEELQKKFYGAATKKEYMDAVKLLLAAIEESPLKKSSQSYRKDVEAIIVYINAHLHEKIQVQEVAAVVNFTESYISRLFKNEVGMNLLSYINLKKMERAMYALFDKNKRIKEIADELGYEEQSYFNRLFNRCFGKNPSEVQNYFAEMYK